VEKQEALYPDQVKKYNTEHKEKRATAACELTWMKLLMSEIGATQGDPLTVLC